MCPLRLLPLMRRLCLWHFRVWHQRKPDWIALYKNKNEGNENKIMLGDLDCTMFKIDRNGENKTERLYRCCSNYALSKLIMDNGFEDLWRKERPDSPPSTIGSLPRILDRQVLC